MTPKNQNQKTQFRLGSDRNPLSTFWDPRKPFWKKNVYRDTHSGKFGFRGTHLID